jgi:hypothetical protein
VKSGNARDGHIWKGMVTIDEYVQYTDPQSLKQGGFFYSSLSSTCAWHNFSFQYSPY